MNEPRTFTCSICGDPSTDICTYCTKDACPNHRCPKCLHCSDCCACDVPLDADSPAHEAEPQSAGSTSGLSKQVANLGTVSNG